MRVALCIYTLAVCIDCACGYSLLRAWQCRTACAESFIPSKGEEEVGVAVFSS